MSQVVWLLFLLGLLSLFIYLFFFWSCRNFSYWFNQFYQCFFFSHAYEDHFLSILFLLLKFFSYFPTFIVWVSFLDPFWCFNFWSIYNLFGVRNEVRLQYYFPHNNFFHLSCSFYFSFKRLILSMCSVGLGSNIDLFCFIYLSTNMTALIIADL